MKKIMSFPLFVLLCLVNVGLLYQCVLLKRNAINDGSSRQHAEWTVYYGIKNVGQSVPMDSITAGHHFLLRYNSTTCLTCITKAEELLDDVFGKEYLAKELCCIGEYGQVKPSKDILFVQSHERLTPTDDVYTPYFCVINDNGDVLFTLSLIPNMYDYNREILIRLKKTLTDV